MVWAYTRRRGKKGASDKGEKREEKGKKKKKRGKEAGFDPMVEKAKNKLLNHQYFAYSTIAECHETPPVGKEGEVKSIC